jgi:hypothetical protein
MVTDIVNNHFGQARCRFGRYANDSQTHGSWPRDVITVMRRQASAAVFESFWNSRFPRQIDANPVIAEELSGPVIELEGEELVSVPLGHTDSDNSSVDTRNEWISALDTIESLNHARWLLDT